MKLTRVVVLFAALLFLNGILAQSASATPMLACQSLGWDLRFATYDAKPSFTNPQDLSSNLTILNSVLMSLTDVKHPYVEENLTRFQTNLNGLAAQSKLDPAVAQRLSAQAQDVTDCANTL